MPSQTLIHWTEKRAFKRSCRANLGLQTERADVLWGGCRGPRWAQLLLRLMVMGRDRRAPQILLLHVGGNELAARRNFELVN
ncbi:hypothetical protein FKM82_017796 [Ascaphus truei]